MLDRSLLINSSEVLLQRHGERLKGLLGKAIARTWSVWDIERDEWLADEVVVLETEDSRLELGFIYLDSIAVSWDQIDLSTAPSWMVDWQDSPTIKWRCNQPNELGRVVGKTIRRIAVVEYLDEFTEVQDHPNPENVGRELANWVLHGLEFDFDDACLVIFNDFDKTGISSEPPTGFEYRRIEVR